MWLITNRSSGPLPVLVSTRGKAQVVVKTVKWAKLPKGYAYYAEEDCTHSLCVANSGDDQSSKAGARYPCWHPLEADGAVGDTSYYSQVHKLNMEAKNTDISSRRAELRQLTQGSSIKFIFKP